MTPERIIADIQRMVANKTFGTEQLIDALEQIEAECEAQRMAIEEE